MTSCLVSAQKDWLVGARRIFISPSMLLMPQHTGFSKTRLASTPSGHLLGHGAAQTQCATWLSQSPPLSPRTTVAWSSPDPEHWLASLRPPCAPSHRSICNELHTQSSTQCLRRVWFAPQVKAAIYSRGRQSDPESRVGLSCCRASRFACHGYPWHVSTFDGRQLQRSDHLAVVH